MKHQSAIEKMLQTTRDLHEKWKKRHMQFLTNQERDLLMNYDMFEANTTVEHTDIESLESKLMKENFGPEASG
jgi:hypothetical protein